MIKRNGVIVVRAAPKGATYDGLMRADLGRKGEVTGEFVFPDCANLRWWVEMLGYPISCTNKRLARRLVAAGFELQPDE